MGILQSMNELTIEELSNSDMTRSRIFTISSVLVMLARDLSELYGTSADEIFDLGKQK